MLRPCSLRPRSIGPGPRPVPRGAAPCAPRCAAFTLVELLVVISIIGVLAGVLLVAFGGVIRGSRTAQAERQLRAVVQAIETFKTDLTYLPPLLAIPDAGWRIGDDASQDATTVVPEASADPIDARAMLRRARYASEYTLATYLMGIGDVDGSENGTRQLGASTDNDDGNAGPGIRTPGPDKSWGGAVSRNDQTPATGPGRAIKTGRVFGPYLDPATMENALSLDTRTGLFRILDVWGQPIRYYAGWPTVDLNSTQTPRPKSVRFMPVELRTRTSVEKELASSSDLQLDQGVLNVPYMVISAGAPFEVNTDGSPRASFGDRRRSDPALLTQDLSQGSPAPLTTLSAEDREGLLAGLASNVRVSP